MLFPNRKAVAQVSVLLASALLSGTAVAAPPGPRPEIAIRERPAASAAAAFTIVDDGMPLAKTYGASAPVGFNDTGQIFGTALRLVKGNRSSYLSDTSCMVWTGTSFVDLSPSLTLTACSPYSMSSATGGGAYTVVGAFTDIHHGNPQTYPYIGNSDAFSASVTAAGSSKFVPYYDHSPAALYSVNSASMAVGYSYNPVRNAVFVTAPPQELTWLQPSCATQATGCLVPLESVAHMPNDTPALACPFGGCSINDAGVVLGFDPASGEYAVHAVGATSSPIELPIPSAKAAALAINDAGQVLYLNFASGSSTQYVVSAVYAPASGVSTIVPTVTGTSCHYYYPLSLNNLGEVLGYTSDCTHGGFYWTWDSVHGTQVLNTQLPANAYKIKALGVNDNGQILVSLVTSTGETHWGTLDPVAAASARTKKFEGAR